VFSRKPIFGYRTLVFAFFGIASLSFAVWTHHMFTTGQVNLTWFSVMTFLIAVPTGIKFFNWIGTMWGGKLRFPVPMLFALGFLPFLVGGITEVFLSERIGRWHFWLWFCGFVLTFLPQFQLGLDGMPRRIGDYATYAPHAWTPLNRVSTAGAAIMAVAGLLFIWNVLTSLRGGAVAGNDPWKANSLEWATSSPPPPTTCTPCPRSTPSGPSTTTGAVWPNRRRAPTLTPRPSRSGAERR
jgi:cytochrome c oxidase subunit I